MKRIFLDWNKNLIKQTVEYFYSNYSIDGKLDLQKFSIIFSGNNGARNFLQLLKKQTSKNQIELIEPKLFTVGSFLDELLDEKKEYINNIESTIFWYQAVCDSNTELFSTLTNDTNFLDSDSVKLSLAKSLQVLWKDISAGGISFADVIAYLEKNNLDFELKRWIAIDEVFRTYIEKLNQFNLHESYSSWLEMLNKDSIHCENKIYLIALPDLNNLSMQIFEKLDSEVSSLIYCTEAYKEKFTDLGTLVKKEWINSTISNERIECKFSGNFFEMLDSVSADIKDLSSNKDEVTFGLIDESLSSLLKSSFDSLNLKFAKGLSLKNSHFVRTLKDFESYLIQRSFQSLSTLLRNPFAWDVISTNLSSESCNRLEALIMFNQYQEFHLQEQVAHDNPNYMESDKQLNMLIKEIDNILNLLFPKKISLADWGVNLKKLNSLMNKLEPAQKVLEEFCSILEDSNSNQLYPINLLLKQTIFEISELYTLEKREHTENENTIEVLGWLELLSDTKENLVLMGLNEENIPTSVNAHLFLPNTIRYALNLQSNESRLARDKYVFSCLVNSRKKLICHASNFSQQNEPLKLSRLLLSDSTKNNANNILEFYDDERSQKEKSSIEISERQDLYKMSDPQHEDPIKSIGVTGFRDYLQCPYRFYLTHVLRLKETQDGFTELPAGYFGNIIHAILAKFGESELAQETSHEKIFEFLEFELDSFFKFSFASSAFPALRIQNLSLRERLRMFSKIQADWCAAGNIIKFIEKDIELKIQDEFVVKGRVDRVDFNENTQTWSIIDYKTGDELKTPMNVHQKGDGWIDLQLPLYQFALAKDLEKIHQGEITLNFFSLPAELEKAKIIPASWGKSELEEALKLAKEISTKVKSKVFWPPSDPKLKQIKYDNFAQLFPENFQ